MKQGGIEPRHLEALVTFLAVVRLGQYAAAARSLQVNHSTISRRVAELEKATGGPLMHRTPGGLALTELGEALLPAAERAEAVLQDVRTTLADATPTTVRLSAPEAYSAFFAAPALARVQRRVPEYNFEITAVTQTARQRRTGTEIEVVVGTPCAGDGVPTRLRDYQLRLFASADYLRHHHPPSSLGELATHRLIYYIGPEITVEALSLGARQLPMATPGITSTSVFAQVGTTAAGAGIGLLPDFVGQAAGLVPVLADVFRHDVSYWAVIRPENLKRPAVRAALAALAAQAPVAPVAPV